MHFRRSYYSFKLSLQFISRVRNQSKTQEVLFRISDHYASRSMSKCFRTYHSFWKDSDYSKSSVFNDIESF